MAGHTRPHRGQTDDWITPEAIIDALGGWRSFALDPCASPTQPWPCARRSYVPPSGLTKPWAGRVFLNPPYGPELGAWLEKLADHGTGTALTFARTETRVFREQVWERATALKFLYGRLFFYRPDGTRAAHNSGGPSVLIAYGDDDAQRLSFTDDLPGRFVAL